MAETPSGAQVWGLGGADYDSVSYAISDALAHTAQRLWPRPGEQVLDIATGTGWTARNLARHGARVTAVDLSEGMIDAARELSAHVVPPIEFVVGDAQDLPFDDASFDGVASTFGLMFAPDPARAADELARVCRAGGRIAIATWDGSPDGYIGRFFELVGRFDGSPPPDPSPLAWGSESVVRELLGGAFEIHFEQRDSMYHPPDPDEVWREYLRGFGPIRALVARFEADADEAGLAEFRRAFTALHEGYRGPVGLTIARRYAVVSGVRRRD